MMSIPKSVFVISNLSWVVFIGAFLCFKTSNAQEWEAKLQRASELLNAQQFEQALQVGIELSKSDTAVLSGFGFQVAGNACLGLNEVNEALRYFNKADALYPTTSLFASKGQIFLDRYELDSAISNYMQAFQLFDEYTFEEDRFTTLLNLGILLKEVESLQAASQFLKQSSLIRPSDWKPYYHLSDVYAKNYQPNESLAYADSAAMLNGGNNPSVTYLKASALFFLRKPAEAAELSHSILQDSLVSFSALGLLGTIHESLNQLDSAHYYFDKALSLEPDDVVSLNNLAWVNLRKGLYDVAKPMLEQAIALDGGFAFAHSNMAFVLLKLGQPEKALEYANSAIALDNGSTYAYVFRANIYFELNDMEKACKDISRVSLNNYPNREELKRIQLTCEKR